MNKDHLLEGELAKRLYETVRDLPIIDYHNHLCVADIASDRQFKNITALWLTPDPYKHRAMRILGVAEKYITGDATDLEKFEKWYNCLPRLMGSPLFDWSLMEFNRVLDMELMPFSRPAKEVYDEANEKLKYLSARQILGKFNIEYSAPCASLCDDLSSFDGKTLCPSLRGDDIVDITEEFIKTLEEKTDIKISDLKTLEKAIETRLILFKEKGLRFTDHALDSGFCFKAVNCGEIFKALLDGKALKEKDRFCLSSYLLKMLAGLYAKHGLTMQLHIGAQRQTSTRLRNIAGKAGGFAAIGNTADVENLTYMLDEIEKGEYGLPKTVLFTLNPSDNAVMATLSGSYSKDGTEALITQGPAWWWCDHRKGISDMLDTFAAHSVLSTFIGMTTDSRSLLSFVRHDYFRRILCSFIAKRAEKGIYPDDISLLSDTAKRCCYYNVKNIISEE